MPFDLSVTISMGGGELNFLGGMKILWIFLGSSQNWTIRCILGPFLKVKVQNGGYFGLLKFQIFIWGA